MENALITIAVLTLLSPGLYVIWRGWLIYRRLKNFRYDDVKPALKEWLAHKKP